MRDVRRVPRVLLLLVVALAVGGCAQADLRKTVSGRTTVPAAEVAATDPLSAAGQRLLNPCVLLDAQVLAPVGTAVEPERYDLNQCVAPVTAADGRSLSVQLSIGEVVRDEEAAATADYAGLRAVESTSEDACYLTLLAREEEGNQLGMSVQVIDMGADPCLAAREVGRGVAQRVADGPPLAQPDPGSLVGLDPCEVPGDGALQAVLGRPGEPSRYSVHQCSWTSGGLSVDLELRLRYAPTVDSASGDASEIDLGGIRAIREPSVSEIPVCTVSWLHRETGREGTLVEGELVILRFGDYGTPVSDVDPCAAAEQLARAVAGSLPSP